jgi:hypothetical protein
MYKVNIVNEKKSDYSNKQATVVPSIKDLADVRHVAVEHLSLCGLSVLAKTMNNKKCGRTNDCTKCHHRAFF